jgi:auxin responsive GH3 family protein
MHAISSSVGSALAAYSVNYRDIITIECENGWAPMKLAVSSASNGFMRMYMDWDIEEDGKRLDLWGKPLLTRAWLLRADLKPISVPGETGPYAISLVNNYRSFLLLHALFALADPKLTAACLLFATAFVNMLQYIEDEWLVIVDCIEKGIIPVLENTEHVRAALEVSL